MVKEYSYEIIHVDAEAKCMEIVYKAEGHPTMHIGARLPYVGEDLEGVVQMYAPLEYWEELQREVIVPVVGSGGSVIQPTPTEDNAEVVL